MNVSRGHNLFEVDCLMYLPAALAPFPASLTVFIGHGINYICVFIYIFSICPIHMVGPELK